MFSSHPAFEQPADPSISVWRYMDLSKFIWMIQRNALYFCRSDLMGDPFEGHYTKAIVDQENEYIRALESNTAFMAVPHNLDMAREVYASGILSLSSKALANSAFLTASPSAGGILPEKPRAP